MNDGNLRGRRLYIPRMPFGGTKLVSAAFGSIGIEAEPTPESDARTLELGNRYTSGDECLPEKVTMGDFLKVTEREDFDPSKTAFFMPTSTGPCRFGQYQPYLRKVLRDKGLSEVLVFSPTSADGYGGIGAQARDLLRTAWRAIVASDILLKMLLKTRPYELEKGMTDRVYHRCLDRLCDVLREQGISHRQRLKKLLRVMIRAREEFRRIPADYNKERLLIGVVGEIFCRLNSFANENLIRKIEEHGGEVWLSDISEWIWYVIEEQKVNLKRAGKGLSLDMLRVKLRTWIQKSDEHALLRLFRDDFKGYEEPHHIREILNYTEPYLPPRGSLGEMVLSVGKAIYLYNKGADGIIDISPFTCMNGAVCEAVYPRVSRDHEDIPIKMFYFDGTAMDLDRDVGIFMELAKNYRRKKTKRRVYPFYF